VVDSIHGVSFKYEQLLLMSILFQKSSLVLFSSFGSFDNASWKTRTKPTQYHASTTLFQLLNKHIAHYLSMESSPYLTETGVLVFGRVGTLPTPPALVANVVLRLILCHIAILLTWIPLRLLWCNGEFPACVFVVNLWLLILFVFINAAIWHNQDFSGWWLGYGWCDLQAYVQYALVTVYSTSVCAIMQRLSNQVGLTRVTGLSSREKRKRLIAQSLIIFPVPILQIIVTIFVQGQRYGIAPASGCTNAYDATAVFLVFFILPPLLFTIVACFHTCKFPCSYVSSFFFDPRLTVQSKHIAASARLMRAPKPRSEVPTLSLMAVASVLAASYTLWSCVSWCRTRPSSRLFVPST
jgi:hypothetical protein